jgi:acetylornithine deacetylase/succinyl-diaminopimelate desuccinylase-like protein
MNHPIDGAKALEEARGHEENLVRFLREMIAIPAESRQEEERCQRVRREYEALGFDEVFIDGLGNVVARVGSGPMKILLDGHIDCAGVGDPSAWAVDPFLGKLEDGEVWGRGAVDELPGVACMAGPTSWSSESLPTWGSTGGRGGGWKRPSPPGVSHPTRPTRRRE